MLSEQYPWLMSFYHCLITQYRKKRGHHAQLIYAPNGYGVEALVTGVAHWLLCMSPNKQAACGQCRSCCLTHHGSHPDLHILSCAANNHLISIEQIQQIIYQIYQCSQQSGVKVIWLARAEKLSHAAANALLKILEEPPDDTYFLLTCQSTRDLLETICSRCQQWHLTIKKAQAISWLQKRHIDFSQQDISNALRLSLGGPLTASTLLQLHGILGQQYVAVINGLDLSLKQRDLLYLLPMLDHEDVVWSLYWLASIWLDLVKYKQQAISAIVNLQLEKLLNFGASNFTSDQLLLCSQHCIRIRHLLLTTPGLNRKLLLTELLCSQQRYLLL